MSYNNIEATSLTCFSPLLGDALLVPKGLQEPGCMSVHKGHFGQGATAIPFTGSLVAGPSLSAPLTINSIGLNNHVGVENRFGVGINIGTHINMSALDTTLTAIKTSLNGFKADIVPFRSAATPAEAHASGAGGLFGSWNHNGRSLFLLHWHSDIRLKKNIQPYTECLSKIMKLNPVSYEWRKDVLPTDFIKEHKAGRQIGLIAQEVETIIPELVGDEKLYDDKWKGVDYKKLTAVLVGAVQEQQKKIDELEKKLSSMEENK